jgi:hypothetical protein
MPPRIHPCICGVVSKTYNGMRKHRSKCQEWQARPDPRGLSLARRETSKQDETREQPCPVCQGHRDRHAVACPHDPHEVSRLGAILRNGLDPRFFRAFLKCLARRYEKEASLG